MNFFKSFLEKLFLPVQWNKYKKDTHARSSEANMNYTSVLYSAHGAAKI